MTWETGISTSIAYRRPIAEVLGPIARAGFRAIEVCTAPAHLDLDDAAALRRAAQQIADLGLRVHSLHAPFGHELNITSPDPGQRQHTLSRLARGVDALALFGGQHYVIHPGGEDQRWSWERDRRLQLSVEGLERIWQVCRGHGRTLVVETPLPHLLGGQPRDFAWILERLPGEGTAVCVDTSHCALGGFLLDSILAAGPRLVHVQASDNHGSSDDHLPPGDGKIDWTRVREALGRVDYRGVFMLEVAGDADPAADVERAARRTRQCWEALAAV